MSSQPASTVDAEPLAIIAGGGSLPWEAAAAVRGRRPVIVLALDGEAEIAAPSGCAVQSERIGFHELGRIHTLLKTQGVRDILMLGSVRKRPDFGRMIGDWQTMRLLPKIARAVVGGDDTVLKNVLALVEAEGFRVVGVADAVPELLAAQGTLTRAAPGPRHLEDIALGARYLAAAAPFDIGQAAVVMDGRIVAVEGAEGTDAMLERCRGLKDAGRIRARARAGVLVKRAKRGQELRADLPVVGAQTLRKSLAAGLGGIAVEANRTILAERAQLLAEADKAGAFVVAG